MEDFKSNERFDVALCVFTVVLYILNEEDLKKVAKAAYASLRYGGILLIDIPSIEIFTGYSRTDHIIDRHVSISNQGNYIFKYHESITVKHKNGEKSWYEDEFQIRYWPRETVLNALKEVGFVIEENLSSYFANTGSSYYIMKKV